MDQKESVELFERLSSVLQRNGLGWIVTQVNEQIHIGKTISKEVETIRRGGETQELIFDTVRAPQNIRKGPKAQFSATIDYDEKEKLILLIDGIIEATNAFEMQSEFLKEMRILGGPTEAAFYFEQTGTTDRVMSPNQVSGIAVHLIGFRDLMNKLRQEAEQN